jgi:hypothetical protein
MPSCIWWQVISKLDYQVISDYYCEDYTWFESSGGSYSNMNPRLSWQYYKANKANHDNCFSGFRNSLSWFIILGVDVNCNFDEAKKAYYTKCREYHPDINKSPDACALMQKINEAWEYVKQKFMIRKPSNC